MRSLWCACVALVVLWSIPVAADTFQCAAPGIPVSEDPMNPTISVITVGAAESIDDVNIKIDITMPFIGNLDLLVSSPAGTTVTLHNDFSGAGNTENLDITFDDQGVPSKFVTWDSGCFMQPNPGMLSDFNGQTTNGDWTLSALDTFPNGTMSSFNEWCVTTSNSGIKTPPVAVLNLSSCNSVGGTSLAEMTWTNFVTYDSHNIFVDGNLIASIPGGDTSYSVAGFAIDTIIQVCVESIVNGVPSCQQACTGVTLQGLSADLQVCSAPNALINNTTIPQTVDVINVATMQTIADLQVKVNITHPFQESTSR